MLLMFKGKVGQIGVPYSEQPGGGGRVLPVRNGDLSALGSPYGYTMHGFGGFTRSMLPARRGLTLLPRELPQYRSLDEYSRSHAQG